MKGTFFSSSLFGPNIWSRLAPSSEDNPSLEHFSCWNTSSIGIRSCESANHVRKIDSLAHSPHASSPRSTSNRKFSRFLNTI